MAKIKFFDVKDVQSGQDFDTPVPVGVYTIQITECNEQVSQAGNEMLALTMAIDKGDWAGRQLWEYIVLNENSAWKMKQFLEATGLINGRKKTGSFDTKQVVGLRALVRVKHDTDPEFGTRAKVAGWIPKPEDELEAEDEPEAEAASTDDEELTLDDLNEYDREELEAVVEEVELEDDVSFNARTSDDTLRERIAEALGLEAESEDEDEGESYDDMDTAALRAELAERGLKKSGPKKVLIKRLTADDEDDGGSDPF